MPTAVSSANNNIVNANASVISVVTSTSTPVESTPSTSEIMSPSVKKSLFKKNCEDGMNKYLLEPRESNTHLFRRFSSRVLEQVNFEKKFSSLPQFKPEECQSPSAISVPSSPRVFVQNYRKKTQSLASASASEEDNAEPDTPVQSANNKSVSSGKLIGSQFFGPDFNLDSFKGDEYANATIKSSSRDESRCAIVIFVIFYADNKTKLNGCSI